MDQQVKVKKPGKARIPDHLRRRALVSCDRCKKRRIRCTRSSGADAQEACQNCLEVGAKCESTLPRKTRIYGSVETLSVRFRVLDALVKGLFPSNDTNNIEELYAIAEAHDITLPTFNDQTVAAEVFNQPPPTASTTSPRQSASPASGPKEPGGFGIQEAVASKVTEEKLVPTPHGPSHYIGPSSSFGFVLTVRNMVAEFNAALKTIQPEDERSRISSDFAGSTWSKALDQLNNEESDESSDGTVGRGATEHASAGGSNNYRYRQPYRAGSSSSSTSVSSRSRRATLLSLLPLKDICDRFVEAYFDHVHPNYLLFHQPSFQNRYESMWAQPQQLMRDVEPGWVCCIFMIIAFGAQVLDGQDALQAQQIQRHYLDLVQSKMHHLLSASTLVNVQAILLLQLYQHNCTERNTAFMLLGCASRMAMALGMHREGTSGGFDRLEREIRKRVWWTVYDFEQYQCAILGRPCAIDDADVNITFPDEMVLDRCDSVPADYVDHSIRLARLLSEVRRKIYASPGHPTQQGDTSKTAIAIQFLRDLDIWHHGLPPALRLEYNSSSPKHRRAVTLLHIQFYHVQSLVTRPFILQKVSVQLARQIGKHVRSQDLDKEEMALSNACGIFSRKCTLLLQRLVSTGTFEGRAWLDGYYVYHSVFILSLDFLARPWTEKDTDEDTARKTAVRDIMNALETVKLCPTFKILTQVSLQLAKIVGIFEARSEQPEKIETFREYAEQPQTPFAFDYNYPNAHPTSGNVGTAGNIVNAWFQKAPVEMPWELKDFFGAENFVGVGETNFPNQQNFGVGYGNLQPVATRNELITTAPAPVPTAQAYTHWGVVNTPFIQQTRHNQIHNPHKGHPGMMGQAP